MVVSFVPSQLSYAGGIKNNCATNLFIFVSFVFQRMGLSSKLIVCGLTSNGFSMADPEDRGMIDICGFDSGALQVIQNFVLDQI